jgi:hypothetical protein
VASAKRQHKMEPTTLTLGLGVEAREDSQWRKRRSHRTKSRNNMIWRLPPWLHCPPAVVPGRLSRPRVLTCCGSLSPRAPQNTPARSLRCNSSRSQPSQLLAYWQHVMGKSSGG